MKKKTNKETFTQSVFALMISQAIIKIIGLFYKLYLTNRNGYGDEGNAIAGGGYQIFALALSVTAIGIPNAIAKLIAERSSIGDHKGAYKIFKVALILFSMFGLIGSYILAFFANHLACNYLHIKEAELSIIALSPSIFLVSVISVFKGFFIGRESIKHTAKAQSMDQIIKTMTTIIMIEISVFFMRKNSTELMAACSSLATTIGNIFELLYLFKAYKRDLPQVKAEITNSVNTKPIRIIKIIQEILTLAIPISLTAVITTVSKNIDSITIVNDLKDIIGYDEAKRQYGILSGKVDTLINFPLSFNMTIAIALLPSIAATRGEIKLKERRINQALLLGFILALPVTLIFFYYSDDILKLLFPNASNGGTLLKISCISIIFITIEQISNTILNGIGKTDIPIKSIIIGVISKLILNRILVPKIHLPIGGSNGAAIANVVCHIIASIISFGYLIKKTKIKINIIDFIKVAIIGVVFIKMPKIMDMLPLEKTNQNIKLILSVFSSISAYFIALKITKLLPKSLKTQEKT